MRRIGTVAVVALAVLAGCSSTKDTPKTTVPATSTTVPGSDVSNLLLSACLTNMSNDEVRAELVAMGKSAQSVELFLDEYDTMKAASDRC